MSCGCRFVALKVVYISILRPGEDDADVRAVITYGGNKVAHSSGSKKNSKELNGGSYGVPWLRHVVTMRRSI
jgi:hypothetical protein